MSSPTVITSAGLYAVNYGSYPTYSIKYFLPLYDQRLDPDIHSGTGSVSAEPLTSGGTSATNLFSQLIGEKIWNIVGSTSAYNITTNRSFGYIETSPPSRTATSILGNTLKNSTQERASQVNMIYNGSVWYPLSNVVSGTSISANGSGDINFGIINSSIPSVDMGSIPDIATSANRNYLWNGITYTPEISSNGSVQALFKCRMDNSAGNFKFNKVAIFLQKLNSNGTIDATSDPVLFAICSLNKAVTKTNTGEFYDNFELDIKLDFNSSAGNTIWYNSDYWTKIPAIAGLPQGLFHNGDVAVGVSGTGGAWSPKAKLHLTDDSKYQLAISKDRISDTDTVFIYVSADGGLNIVPKSNTAPILNAGHSNINIGIRNITIGASNSAISDSDTAVIGGTSNNATGSYDLILGGSANKTIDSFYTLIANSVGSIADTVSASSIIGGFTNQIKNANKSAIIAGESNNVSADYSVNIGGTQNNVSGTYSVNLGGNQNRLGGNYSITAGRTTCAAGDQSFTGGYFTKTNGYNSFAWSFNGLNNLFAYSNIIGGANHIMNDINATGTSVGVTILGGKNNTAINQIRDSSIIGGKNNYIYGLDSFSHTGGTTGIGVSASSILGGVNNQILHAMGSSIIGGQTNIIQDSDYASIIGGYSSSIISAPHSAIIGNSTLITSPSAISLGSKNYVYGINSFAIGKDAKVGSSNSIHIRCTSEAEGWSFEGTDNAFYVLTDNSIFETTNKTLFRSSTYSTDFMTSGIELFQYSYNTGFNKTENGIKTFGKFSTYDATGGMTILGINSSDNGLNPRGFVAVEQTITSVGAGGAVLVDGAKITGGVETTASDSANIFVVRNFDQTRLILKGNGTLYTHSGSVTGAFDIEDDIALVEAARYSMTSDPYWSSKVIQSNKDRLEELGIMENDFINNQKMTALNLGAIGQLYNMVRELASKLDINETELKALAKKYE